MVNDDISDESTVKEVVYPRKRRKKDVPEETRKKPRPALSPEARENQLIAAAVDMAEEQILNRTASSQVLVHYLKLATQKERLENEILKKQKDLIEAKTESLQSAKRIEELYEDAIKAMRTYGGGGTE